MDTTELIVVLYWSTKKCVCFYDPPQSNISMGDYLVFLVFFVGKKLFSLNNNNNDNNSNSNNDLNEKQIFELFL